MSRRLPRAWRTRGHGTGGAGISPRALPARRDDTEHTRRRACLSDDGQLLPLSIGYVAVALLLVLVVAAATAVQLDRKRLQSLADTAALDAADALAEEVYYVDLRSGDSLEAVPLASASVASTVDAHLAQQPGAARLPGLQVASAGVVSDGQEPTAVVVLRARSAPLLPAAVAGRWAAGVPLEVRAEAISRIDE